MGGSIVLAQNGGSWSFQPPHRRGRGTPSRISISLPFWENQSQTGQFPISFLIQQAFINNLFQKEIIFQFNHQFTIQSDNKNHSNRIRGIKLVKFCVCIPQDGLNYEQIKLAVRASKDLSFHSVWFYDHLHSFPRPDQNPFLECWTLLSALAEVTRTIRLGSLVTDVQYRNPALLAKMATALDQIGNGQLELAVGAGGTGRASWVEKAGYTPEYRAYGMDFPESPATRIARLREATQVITQLWTGESVTFDGEFVRLQNAYCLPRPRQEPHPPIWIAGTGEQLTLKLVAELADGCNFSAELSPQECTRKLGILEDHCRAFNRSASAIHTSLLTACVIRETSAAVNTTLSRIARRI